MFVCCGHVLICHCSCQLLVCLLECVFILSTEVGDDVDLEVKVMPKGNYRYLQCMLATRSVLCPLCSLDFHGGASQLPKAFDFASHSVQLLLHYEPQTLILHKLGIPRCDVEPKMNYIGLHVSQCPRVHRIVPVLFFQRQTMFLRVGLSATPFLALLTQYEL